MTRILKTALLAAALITPLALTPTSLRADDKKYHDTAKNDDHQWNGQEDKAYKVYNKQNHRKAQSFNNLKEGDQQSYWNWRHEHSDAQLKIVIK
jgi:Ni/Co efflux regulator RcnB